MDKKLFGTRINKARKDRGLTAEKLAEACNINSTYLRQIEGGKKLPSLPVFATLCRELRVSPNYILPDLVEGTEAEKIQKIFSESDPTPSQIEMLAEMAGVIMKERYYGKSYRMAPEEIEAAYRYQEMQYRKADALRMLTSYAFGIEDLDAVSDEDRAEYEKEFETSYGITFEEAKESIPEIVSYFFQKTDCNVGENTTWYEAIEAVFGGNGNGD